MTPKQIAAIFKQQMVKAAQALAKRVEQGQFTDAADLAASLSHSACERRYGCNKQTLQLGYTNVKGLRRLTNIPPSHQPISQYYEFTGSVKPTAVMQKLLYDPTAVLCLDQHGRSSLLLLIALFYTLEESFEDPHDGHDWFNALLSQANCPMIIGRTLIDEGSHISQALEDGAITAAISPLTVLFAKQPLLERKANSSNNPNGTKQAKPYYVIPGDVLSFQNHPDYKRKHPSGGWEYVLGVCVKTCSDENNKARLISQAGFLCPEIGPDVFSEETIHKIILEKYHQGKTTNGIKFASGQQEYEKTLPEIMTLDCVLLCEILNHELSLDEYGEIITEAQKRISQYRKRTLRNVKTISAAIHRYLKALFETNPENSDDTDYKQATCFFLKLLREWFAPWLDDKGQLACNVSELERTLPLQPSVFLISTQCRMLGLAFFKHQKLFELALQAMDDAVYFSQLCSILMEHYAPEQSRFTRQRTASLQEESATYCNQYQRHEEEYLRLRHCYSLRLRCDGFKSVNSQKTLLRLHSLTHIAKQKRAFHFQQAVALMELDVGNWLSGQWLKSFHPNQFNQLSNFSEAMSHLRIASKDYDCPFSSLLLAHAYLCDLPLLAKHNGPGANDKHEKKRTESSKEFLRFLAISFFYSDETHDSLRQLIPKYFRAWLKLINTDPSKIIKALDDIHEESTQSLAWLLLANVYSKTDCLEDQVEAVFCLNHCWDNREAEIFEVLADQPTQALLWRWSLDICERAIHRLALAIDMGDVELAEPLAIAKPLHSALCEKKDAQLATDLLIIAEANIHQGLQQDLSLPASPY